MTLTATETTTNTSTENRNLVLQAFAALRSPDRIDASRIYAADVEFVGPGRTLWTGSTPLTDPCFEIEHIEAESDRVVTHATLRLETGAEARGLFVHSIDDGRITRVSSIVRW
jgi:ketosteroid isomerase-like protein